MRALVIGGNRFFGKRLARLLLERRDSVTLLNRGSLDDGFGAAVERIRCDRSDRAALRMAVLGRDWDVVFDQVCYDAAEARAACSVFAGKTRRYVFTSTGSVYTRGERMPEVPRVTEQAFDPGGHVFDQAVSREADYAEAKRQAEAVFIREADFPVVAARFPIVLGEDDYTRRLHFHVERTSRGEPFRLPNPDARISFIDAEDAARALLFVANSSFAGPINCCSPDPVALRELLAWIAAATGREPRLEAGAPESPFAIPTDFSMSAERLASLGFQARSLKDWLPELIRRLSSPC